MILKRLFFLIILFANGYSCMAQDAWPNKNRVLPEALRKVPEAIYIQHSPNPNYPEINNTRANTDSKYVWKHTTTVCSPLKDLTIVKAGSFIWYNASGWKENVEYSRKDFKKKFDCEKGVLKKGECYTFQKNYRWGSQLYGGDALWYVLAKDSEGVIYKGFGLIETESELKN